MSFLSGSPLAIHRVLIHDNDIDASGSLRHSTTPHGLQLAAPERRLPDMGEAAGRERPPWRCTVAVQAALCLALYAAFSLGEPQLIPRGGGAGGVRRRRLPQRRWRRAGTHRAGQAPEAGARVCTHPLTSGSLLPHAHLPASGSTGAWWEWCSSFGSLCLRLCIVPFPIAS